MYILSSDQKTIHDSTFLQRFTIAEKPDAVLICGAISTDKPLVTLGKYKDMNEARSVLLELLGELARDAGSYEMPDSELFHGEHEVRDARVRRRGGS